ncbi:MAG: Bug family tripartite tricarboxylate transporter substrate binding protein [Betaproteobacteria bacterium]
MNAAKLVSLFAALVVAGTASAASPGGQYPTRPIRLIVPFPAGGPTDAIARILGQKLTEAWGQQVVVDNRAGAGGNIGIGIAAQAAPDGHTIIFVSSSYVANPGLYKKIPYDPYKSFAPVTKVAAAPHAFFVHPSQPVKTIGELIELVKKSPNKYNIATPGVGTTPDLSAHLLRLDMKIDLTPIPYAGGGPSLQAVLGNQVPVGCQAIPPVTAHFKAGRLRALALTAEKRSVALPDVPTMAEAGYKGHEADTMTGVLLPAGTPRAIVDKWYNDMKRLVAQPDVNGKITEMGFNIIMNTPQQFSAQIKEEVARWGKVVRDAGIPVN